MHEQKVGQHDGCWVEVVLLAHLANLFIAAVNKGEGGVRRCLIGHFVKCLAETLLYLACMSGRVRVEFITPNG